MLYVFLFLQFFDGSSALQVCDTQTRYIDSNVLNVTQEADDGGFDITVEAGITCICDVILEKPCY